ncbi:arsenic resistance protein, partial [Candidatus Poribacteria bacterium]|nr:arsenic resistance protein [Candidatus Poribacteria bacterium]
PSSTSMESLAIFSHRNRLMATLISRKPKKCKSIVPTKPRDFAKVVKSPVEVLLGTFMIIIAAPVIAKPIMTTILKGYPQLGVGLVLAGSVPPGGMIAAWTGLLEGDIPLALTLQAITLILGIIEIPYMLKWLAGEVVSIPVRLMVQNLVIIVILPLALGFLTRYAYFGRMSGEREQAIKPIFPIISGMAALMVVFVATSLKADVILKKPQVIGWALLSAFTFYIVTFLLSTYICRLFKLNYARSIPIIYGTATKNLSIAIALALATFGRSAVVLGVIGCFMIQMPMASVFYYWVPKMLGRRKGNDKA